MTLAALPAVIEQLLYEQLEKLDEFVLLEWVEQGNKIEHYPESGPKILIILDNASYHKKRDFLEKIEINLPNIQLYFLPPYSPDFSISHCPLVTG